MASAPIPLETIEVAAPCPARWEWMEGDGRVRFCGQAAATSITCPA